MAGRNLRPPLCLKVQQSSYQQYSSLPYQCIDIKNNCKSTHFLRYGKIKMLQFSEILENQLDLNHGVCLFGSLTNKGGSRLIFCILNKHTQWQQSIAFVGQIAIVFE